MNTDLGPLRSQDGAQRDFAGPGYWERAGERGGVACSFAADLT